MNPLPSIVILLMVLLLYYGCPGCEGLLSRVGFIITGADRPTGVTDDTDTRLIASVRSVPSVGPTPRPLREQDRVGFEDKGLLAQLGAAAIDGEQHQQDRAEHDLL